MRSIWKGRIGFGLIGLDVKLYKATETKETSFHLMHTECGGGRIKYLYQCQNCASLVSRAELKKGYEYAKEQYVILDDADFASLPLKSLKTIEIVGFVGDSLDPRIVEDTYYLSAEKGSDKAYQLLHSVMAKLSVKAIGKLAYREREHLCLIFPFDSIFALQTLCYAEELRPYDELRPKAVQLSDKELELGEMLVKQMMTEFDHASFTDEYKQALERLVEAKVEGREITAPAEAQVLAGDLVAQLLASVGMK